VASIFVAYRESDARGWAFALRDLLVQAYGSDAVFLDKDSLRAGAWSAQLEQAIEGCKVMLVVIGNGWLQARDDSGARRLDANDDVHRREIEYALALPQVTVLPLLVDRAQPLRADDLPPSLARLEAQQGLPWGDSARHRQADSERLFDELDRLTGLRARRPRAAPRAGLLPLLGVSALLTVAAATALARATERLDGTEWTVLFVATTLLVYGTRVVWRRLRAAG
jgi:hypothetical protein